MSMMREALAKPLQETWLWYGTFAYDVDDFLERAYVILPDFNENQAVGPCRWQARDSTSLPDKGDDCLVMYDNRGQLWVVAWWPYDT
jgi:hypothetical protein